MLIQKAYAKINLGLNVIDRDSTDSYHNLDMINCPLELHDLIEIQVLPEGYDTLITSDEPSLPTDKTNIVTKAINSMREKYGFKQNFRIFIHKNIPMGAGLGGGSANAAAVILGINQALKLKAPIEELIELGRKVGSDVPFCLIGKASRVNGKGELVKPIKVKSRYSVIIIYPGKPLFTKDVYQKYDEIGTDVISNNDGVTKGLEEDDLDLIINSMNNALEKSANALCNNKVEELKNKLLSLGLNNAMMTGSGSCVFSLTKDNKLAKRVYERLIKEGYKAFLTITIK